MPFSDNFYFLRKKNRAYKSFVRSGRPDDKLEGIQRMITEGARLIEEAKRNYFFKAGKTLSNPGTSSKTYWTLINTVLDKAKIPMFFFLFSICFEWACQDF